MNLQDLVNGMNARMQKERAAEQMTLGDLIDTLAAMSPDTIVQGIDATPALHSYRGYYCDIAIEPGDGVDAGVLLKECRDAKGQVFEGYKGGDFMMGAATPVWIATYGSGSGQKLMALGTDGVLTLAEDA